MGIKNLTGVLRKNFYNNISKNEIFMNPKFPKVINSIYNESISNNTNCLNLTVLVFHNSSFYVQNINYYIMPNSDLLIFSVLNFNCK